MPVSCRSPWLAAVLFAVSTAAAPSWPIFKPPTTIDDLQDTIDGIISSATSYYNVSLSFAVGFDGLGDDSELKMVASAGGFADHTAGTVASITSKYPSGSVTKAMTAVAALRLAEIGRLDLDTPVHQYIDPWFQKQSPPLQSLSDLWDGNSQINEVTSRHLMQMRSGILDYNDGVLFDWTLKNPNSDYLPIDFLRSVNKTLAFQPGKGGLYSGNGYVLLGMVIAAVSGAPTWDKLDQKSILGPIAAATLNHSVFMTTGKCSQHSGVVHQYVYGSSPYGVSRYHADRGIPFKVSGAPRPSAIQQCPSPGGEGWYGGYAGTPLTVLGSSEVDGPEACCTFATSIGGAGAWSFTKRSILGSKGNCTAIDELVGGTPSIESTCGQLDRAVKLSDYTDLDDYSCLNGWTMGNIAAAPQDIVKFYHSLGSGQILNSSSLNQMLHFLPLTMGREPPAGTPYGLGVLAESMTLPLANVTKCGSIPYCTCHSFVGCATNFSGWAHPGLDWGSGMPEVLWIPELQMSYAMAFNSYKGMNTTIGLLENSNTHDYGGIFCVIMSAIVQFRLPEYPRIECSQGHHK